MKKNNSPRWRLMVCLAMAITMILTPIVYAEEYDDVGVFPELSFSDVSENWSYKHITKLALQGIINGLGNGTFAPNNPVSQQDVIVLAVQFMGITPDDDPSQEAVLPFEVAEYAMPYVQTALEQRLINIEEEQDGLKEGEHWGRKHASREWVAKMTIRSLQLDGVAKEMEGMETTFDDRDLISEGFESYIRAAVELGIVSGLPGNTFAPDAPVTRAQMAVFLSLGEAYQVKLSPRVVEGVLVSWDDDEMELQTSDGEHSQFTLHSDVRYFSKEVNDRMISSSEITPGDHIYVIHFNNEVLFVEWIEEGEEVERELQITPYKLLYVDQEFMELTVDRDGAVRIYPLASDVVISDEFDQPLNLEDLKPNSLIDVLQDLNDPAGTIFEIKTIFIPIDKTAVGILDAYDSETSMIWVKGEENDKIEEYPVINEVELIYRNTPLHSLEELKQGDEILYRVENSRVIRIELLETSEPRWEEVQGTVSAFNLEDGLISIRKLDGAPAAYNVHDHVEILLDGKPDASIADLRTSDQVRIQINTLESDRVEQIRILNRSISASGLVEVVHYSDRTSSFTVFDPETDEVQVFKINEDTIVNGSDYWTSDMLAVIFPEGRKVNIIANENDIIQMEDSRYFEGTIRSWNTANRTFELDTEQYGKMSFRWMASANQSADVQVGSRVRITLDGSQQYVAQFAILDQKLMVVNRINSSENEITAHDLSGKEYVLRVDRRLINQLQVQHPILVELAGDDARGVVIPNLEYGEVRQVDGSTVQFVTRSGEVNVQSADQVSGVSIEGRGMAGIEQLKAGDKAQLLIDPEEGHWYLHVYAAESRNFWQYHAGTEEVHLRRGSFDQKYKFQLHHEFVMYDANDELDISDLLDGDRIKVYYLHDQIIEIERQ